jgi:hypothetical protein
MEDKKTLVYFIVEGTKRSQLFIKLSNILAQKGSFLIPIQIDQLSGVNSNDIVICVSDTFQERRIFASKFARFLEVYCIRKEFILLHLSSSETFRIQSLRRSKVYLFIQFPLSLNMALEEAFSVRQEQTPARNQKSFMV